MSLTKVKLSITIDDELVKWIDSMIKQKRFANRSHSIEYAVTQLKENSEL